MKEYLVMQLNGLLLIFISLYGYLSADPDKKSATAFIGAGIGIVLLLLSFPVKKDNHVMAHIAVVFTLIAAAGLFFAGIRRGNNLILVMAVITLIAFLYYVYTFLQKKKNRQGGN